MFKFQWVMPKFDTEYAQVAKPILQVIQTHKIVEHEKEIAIEGMLSVCVETTWFLRKLDNPQCQTIETIYDDEEYNKARMK